MDEYDGYSSCPRCDGEIKHPVAGLGRDSEGDIVNIWLCSPCAGRIRHGARSRQVPDTVEQLLASWSGSIICSPNELHNDPVHEFKSKAGQWARDHPEEAASLAARFRAMMDSETGTTFEDLVDDMFGGEDQ